MSMPDTVKVPAVPPGVRVAAVAEFHVKSTVEVGQVPGQEVFTDTRTSPVVTVVRYPVTEKARFPETYPAGTRVGQVKPAV
jgi:hypothetical protein